jgi:hypothetical protein
MLIRKLVLLLTLALFGCSNHGAPHPLGASLQPSGTGVNASSSGAPVTPALNGDAGYVLTSNGASTVPSFQAPAAAGAAISGGDVILDGGAATVVGVQGRPYSDAGVSSNQVYAWNGTAWTPTTVASLATGGWINSLLGTNGTCDWTAQGTATLTSDGTYSYCGTTLTKFGTAYESTPMHVTSGVGLTISPTSGSRYDTTYTAPLALVQFSSAIPGFTSSTPVELCTSLSSALPAGDYAEGFIGMDTGTSLVNNWRAGLAHNGSLGQQISMVYNASQAFNGNVAGAADVTECLTWPSGLGVPLAVLSSSPTAYSGGVWPDTVVRLVGTWAMPTPSYGSAFSLPASSGYSAIVLGAQGQGASGYVANATATRIRFK